jgi:hypothetical protein
LPGLYCAFSFNFWFGVRHFLCRIVAVEEHIDVLELKTFIWWAS